MVAKMKATTGFELGRSVFLNLKRQPELSEDDLSVKAEGEVITLEGIVKSRDEKRAVEEAAMKVNGVKVVASDIVVKPALERADTEIAKDIIHKFQSHTLIPIEGVKAIISNGQVTLEGSVSSNFKRMLAEAAAKNVRGITGLRNNIEVGSGAFTTETMRRPEAEEITALPNNRGAWAELGAAEAG